MCTGKVRFTTEAEAVAEVSLQAAQRPHWRWSFYDCLWCDFIHIGRQGVAEGHSRECLARCARRTTHERELRILEGTW
jgi:hypothetical protein